MLDPKLVMMLAVGTLLLVSGIVESLRSARAPAESGPAAPSADSKPL